MSIQIHINGESAIEAIRELSVLAKHLAVPSSEVTSGPTVQDTNKSQDKPQKPSKSKSEETVAGSAEPSSGPQPDVNEKASGSSDQQKAEINTISAAELRAKATAVSQAGKQAQVKALLTEFGAANISTVPEEKRNDFYKALEDLENE